MTPPIYVSLAQHLKKGLVCGLSQGTRIFSAKCLSYGGNKFHSSYHIIDMKSENKTQTKIENRKV